MAYCNQCGGHLDEGDHYCSACGAPAGQVPAPGAPPPPGAALPPQPPPLPPPLPGQVPPGLECQGVGIRLAAQIIDSAVMLVFYLIVGRLVAGRVGGLTPDGFELQGGPAFAVIALNLVFWMAYFTLLEGLWRGQTLGKKLLRLKVVRQADGGPVDLSTALLRNLLRLVDGQLGYLVGAILVWRSPLKQRLGDRVAHTLVVRKPK
ncbi:MAG: RDD family protein [Desulfarculus sp.]|nr:RDD family protein [Desulfarculus sp.]